VVFFTTSRDHLERRFDALKTTLNPADGLWIAWPKKAAKIESDLTFEVVQEIGLSHGLVDNKSCAIERSGLGSPFGSKGNGRAPTAVDHRSVTRPRSAA
jgi:hypothetical protein